jgi:hypothetical protein
VALELAGRGVAVDLFEAGDHCLTGASASNEGKIHLGYVYANDPSLSTARTLVRGGLGFAPSLRRWLGSQLDSVPVSRPFDYVVHRDSLLTPDEVERHLVACWELARDEAGGARPDYFGAHPLTRPQRVEVGAGYDRRAVAAVFRTPEVGIDPQALARLMRARIEQEVGIRSRTGTRVLGVERNGTGIDVEFQNGAGPARERYDQVVNALWDGRLAVDRSVGLDPPRPWLWRVKRYVRMALPPGVELPSATIVLGPFGDLVAWDREAYLSWYPAGMRGVSRDIEPPAFPAPVAGELCDAIFAGLATVVPSVAGLPRHSAALGGGVIFAWGETDIDDPASGLHERHQIGTRSVEGYHSIDTGKLTMAPVFGRAAAERVLATA